MALRTPPILKTPTAPTRVSPILKTPIRKPPIAITPTTPTRVPPILKTPTPPTRVPLGGSPGVGAKKPPPNLHGKKKGFFKSPNYSNAARQLLASRSRD